MIDQTVNTLMQAVQKLWGRVSNSANTLATSSLADATALTRVEPLTIISKDLINLEYMPDVTNTMLNIFAGYYLQAVDILTKVQNVEVVKLLDKLNPNRDSTGLFAQYALESIPTLMKDNYKYKLPMKNDIGMEADNKNNLNEFSNLAVGKFLNVRICIPATTKTDTSGTAYNTTETNVDLQVAVRLITSVIPDNVLLGILAIHADDKSFTERWHAWRAGRISFIKDLIFCQDLIDEWKRAALADKSDTVLEISRRVNNSRKYGLLSQNPSLVSASNLFIISEENARAVESKLGGRLSNTHVREKLFDNTYAMVIAVVDREYERVTFYTRGAHSSIDVSVKELKANSKGKGPDIFEIFKSMQIGAPAF